MESDPAYPQPVSTRNLNEKESLEKWIEFFEKGYREQLETMLAEVPLETFATRKEHRGLMVE